MRKWLFLIAAFALLVVAVLLMLLGDDEGPREMPAVNFPSHLRGEEIRRMEARRTLPAPPIMDPDKPAPPPLRDPLLKALNGSKKTAMVVEANALRHSRVGELLLDCLRAGRGDPLDRMQKELGVDPLKDIDRVAITDDVAMVSGFFDKARWGDIFAGVTPTQFGGASLYEPRLPPDFAGERPVVAVWKNQMVLEGPASQVRAAIDRMEGRAPEVPPLLPESSTYGEIYGVLPTDELARMFPKEQADLAERLARMAQRVELHVDAMKDVAMVANITGPNSSEVEDLGKSLGAALSIGRIKAQADGDKDLAELLDYARVSPRGAQASVELALPIEVLEKRLAFCRERLDAKLDGGVAPPLTPRDLGLPGK